MEKKALEAKKPDETAFLSPDPCCTGLLVYQVTLDLSILVYPLYRYQDDTAETQILLRHHFCLKFFWDSFCLQEKPRHLYGTFKAARPPSPLSQLNVPAHPLQPQSLVIAGRAGQLPAYEQAKLFITSVPLNKAVSSACSSLPPSHPPLPFLPGKFLSIFFCS